ncbi:ADP-ribosyltransferase [Epilithonimonas sp.]|uniref:ADP-ribosyltransferase n=1 Tax=Epilithonimonas sp. TaxID=2894511 RepID=UPI002897D6E1|nr:ADP-ribosyltransferase [Epilithonimonas sp.]
MKYKEYFKDFDDFDEESQQILLSAYDGLLLTNTFQQNKLLSKQTSQKTSNIDQSASSVSDITDWETDEYVNLNMLIGSIKYFKNEYGNFQFLYNIKDIKSNFQNRSISDNKNNTIRLKVYRSKKVGNVSLKIGDVIISQQIDAKNQKIYYRLTFHYVDSDEKAFVLETYSYQELYNLNNFLNFRNLGEIDAANLYFLRNFANALHNESDPVRLKFLYTNIPDSILENLYKSVENKTFFNHLEILTKYDKDGIFSGFKDGSSAIIQIFKALKKAQNITDYYRKFPEKLNTIFYNLDGNSEYEGKQQSNKMILANIMLVLCLYSKTDDKAVKSFTIGKGYKINTKLWELGSILGFGNSDAGTFFLQQQKEEERRIKVTAKEDDPNATETVATNLDDGAQFHPLDMVYLTDLSAETDQAYFVPAIYMKALADAEEWKVVMQNIRMAADLLAVVIGIATLPTGNPYFLLLAIADITLAGADLTIQAFREQILLIEGGEDFLNKWEQIYTTGGFAIAGLTLVGGFYAGAARLLTKLADGSAKTYLKTLVLKAILETNISNFQRNTIKILESREIFLGREYAMMGQQMAENGVVFISGVREGKYQFSYAGIYKGEIIMDFNKAELSRVFKDWWRLKGEKMIELLEWKYNFSVLKKNEQFVNIYSKVLQEKYHLLKQFINFEEEAVIRYYTTSAYDNLNKYLRKVLDITNEDVLRELDAFADALRKALGKLPNSKVKTLYRSFYMEESQLKALFKEGGVYEEKAFMSASADYDDFLKYWLQENQRHNVIMKIEGKTAKSVREISDMPEESEAMFLDGKQFDVTGVKKIDHPLDLNKKIIEIKLKEK